MPKQGTGYGYRKWKRGQVSLIAKSPAPFTLQWQNTHEALKRLTTSLAKQSQPEPFCDVLRDCYVECHRSPGVQVPEKRMSRSIAFATSCKNRLISRVTSANDLGPSVILDLLRNADHCVCLLVSLENSIEKAEGLAMTFVPRLRNVSEIAVANVAPSKLNCRDRITMS